MPPIGERLRQARLDRGMTVRGLARVVDTSASLISQIETGKSNPSVSTLYAITAALGISVEDIFNEPGATSPRAGAVIDPVAPVPAALGAAIGAALAAPTPPAADQTGGSATTQGLRMLSQRRRVGPVVAAGEREVLHLDSGVTWELLGQLPDTHVDFLRITYAPGGSSSGA